MRESPSVPENWTGDSAVYPVIADVSQHSDGSLVYTLSYPNKYPSFYNTKITPASFFIFADKQTQNRNGESIPFCFELLDPLGNVISSATNQNGVVAFPPLTVSALGDYYFKIAETSMNNRTTGGITKRTIYIHVD